MLYLLLAIGSSAMVSIVMRLSQRKVTSNLGMLVMNYLMCTLLSAACAGFAGLFTPGARLHVTAAMGVINGLLYLVSFVLLQVNVKRNGVVLSSTFMKLGLLVTMVVSVCFFHEVPDILQISGFVIAVAAIILINYRREKTDAAFRAGLIWLLLTGGMADAMSKIFEESGTADLSNAFLFYTFLTALVLCAVVTVLNGQRCGKWEIFFGLLIGIPNFFSSKFLLRALAAIPAVIVYPVYSVGGILAVTLAGVLLFREGLDKRQWAAMGLILASLVMLNV